MTLHERLYAAIKEHSSMERDEIVDAARHEADAGWSGFTYTVDAVKFYDANESDIYELLGDMANSMGAKNVDALVAGFARSDMLGTPDGRKNLLAWFALEEIGRWLEDQQDESDNE